MAEAYNQFSPLQSIAYVQQQGEMGRQRGQQNQLAQLAGQSYGANTPEQRQSLLTSMAVIDPAAAQSQQQQFQSDEDRQRKLVYGAATYLKGALDTKNPAAIAGAWRSVRPGLINAGIGTEADYAQDWQPEYEQMLHQVLASSNAGGSGASGVQSTYINRAGQRVAIMRDGSQQVLGEADARTQLRDQEGVAPSIINLRTGEASPLQAAGATPQAPAPAGVYIDPSLPPEVQAGIRQAEAAGVEYTGQTPNNTLTATRPDSSQMITPYQQAQLSAQYRDDARADQAMSESRQERERAASTRNQAAQLKAQQAQQSINTRQAQLADVRRGVERVRSALGALDSSAIGTGPAAQYAQQFLPAGQELETAVNAMNNSLLALTRVPGIGAQSDLEARIAGMRFPQLGRDEGVNRRTLQDLESFINDLSRTAQQSDATDRAEIQAAGNQGQGQSRQPSVQRARNPQTGEVVELRNGQWVPVR